jgi:hypothetical protein
MWPYASGVFWRVGIPAGWLWYISPGGGVDVIAIGMRGPRGCLGPGESVLDMGVNALIGPGVPIRGPGGYACEPCELWVIVLAGMGLSREEYES